MLDGFPMRRAGVLEERGEAVRGEGEVGTVGILHESLDPKGRKPVAFSPSVHFNGQCDSIMGP
jgi:hypothetical protein